MKQTLLTTLVILLAIPLVAQQRATIKGRIVDEHFKAIEGATITLLPSGRATLSDGDGNYFIRIPLARLDSIRISAIGYSSSQEALKLPAGESLVMNFTMKRSTNTLDEVQINAVVNVPGEVRRLADVHNTYIIAGKKNEVIAIEGMNANLAEKTGRQLFAKIPGTFVYDMDGSGNQVNISTRGLDPHRSWEYNVRQNGIMTNSDIYGYPASHYSAPMESISKIELVRGTSSLQYGAEFGGMINYITKNADTSRPFSFESINSAGSFGLLSTYNAVGGKSGKFTYYGYYSRRVSDGYRKDAHSNYTSQFISLGYQLSSKASLKAELGHMEYLYRIPGALTDKQFREDPSQSTRSRNYFNPDIYVPSVTLDWKLTSNTSLRWTSSAALGRRNSVQFLGFANVADTIDASTGKYKPRQVDIDGFNSYTSELRVVHDYNIGKIHNTVSAGVRYINNDLHRRQLGKGTTGTDFDLSVTDEGYGRDLHYKTSNVAFFAETLVRLTKNLRLTPGFRFESGRTKMEGVIRYYDPGDVPKTIRHSFPLFGIGGQYSLPNGSQVYGGWSQAYRPVIFADIIPPTTMDRTDKNLKDARGYNAELGIRSRSGGWFSYDISGFLMEYNNRTGSMIVNEGADSYILKTNLGSSLSKGLEIFMEWRPLVMNAGGSASSMVEGTSESSEGSTSKAKVSKAFSKNFRGGTNRFRFSVYTSTSFMDASYLNGNVVSGGENKSIKGNRLETVPRWISRNGINFGYSWFSGSLQYSFVSESYSDALNTEQPTANGSAGLVPSYQVVDLHTSWKLHEHVTLKLGINNLFDEQYFTKRPAGYPGPGVWSSDGRGVVGTVVVKM